MKWLLFALKRCLRDRAFILALAAAALLIALAPMAGGSTEYPPVGVCDTDGGATAAAITDGLLAQGFVPCSDEEDLMRRIESGELDCGIIILPGLDGRVESGDTGASLVLVTSPSSASAETARIAAAAMLYRYAAPYVAAPALSDQGVTPGEFAARYERYFDGGLRFSFDISTASSAQAPTSARARSLTMGCAAAVLFALVMYGNLPTLGRDLDSVTAFVGLRRGLLCSAVPNVLVRGLLILVAAAVGLTAAAFVPNGDAAAGLILPCAAYIAALIPLSLLLSALFRDEGRAQTLVVLLLLGGIALSPIFTDLALTVPAVSTLRAAMPPCWLWWAAEDPWLWLGVSVMALPFAAGALCLSRAWRSKLKLKKDAAGLNPRQIIG